MLMVAMVRIRIGQMGISSSLGMWRRGGGKREERGVGMDVDAVNGEGDKDRKWQAQVDVSMPLLQGTLHPELPPLSLPLGPVEILK